MPQTNFINLSRNQEVVSLEYQWALRPKPAPYELLSSWIARMGFKNCGMLHPFCHSTWPGKPIWNRDIDTLSPNYILNDMAQMTGLSNRKALETTFGRFEGIIYPKVNKAGPTKLINRIGVYHRTRTHCGLQWCPQCLEEDEEPYYRLHWRLSLFSTCLKHSVILKCRCKNCGSPAAPHRNELPVCHKCGEDRRKVKTLNASSEVLQLEGALFECLYNEVPPYYLNQNLHPLVFFSTIGRIQSLLVANVRSQRLRDTIQKHRKLPALDLSNYKSPMPELLSSGERHKVNMLLFHILNGWPWMFVGYCQDAGMWWTWVTKDSKLKDLPFPIVHIADQFLSQDIAIRKSMTR